MFLFGSKKTEMVDEADALPGRDAPIPTTRAHHVSGADLREVPEGHEVAVFGLGCFWGAERLFWQIPGVHSTAVGYAGGFTPNPTYEEVCSGRTGHAEVVRVVHDPSRVPYEDLLRVFWEGHDPTQGMRQGNDRGTQYRSAVYVTSEDQRRAAKASLAEYERRLRTQGYGAVTTEVRDAPEFYFAEGYHQQYLAKNPGGYCGLGGTGVSCPVGTGVAGAA